MKTMIGARALLLAAAMVPAGAIAIAPAAAQQVQESPEARLKRIEAEIRALQRKVFPDGAGRTFAPEIAAPAPGAAAPSGAPASTAVSDLLARMDAVEGQLARMTGQFEETQNRLGKLEARIAALEPAPASGPAVVLPSSADAATGATTGAAAAPAARPANGGTIAANTDRMTGGASRPAAAAPAARPAPSAERVAAVQAIEKPASGDRGEDEYLYGFRLWEARFYPEAQQQLQKMVEQFPRHKRVSFARNLLGRAYLDDGKPGTAAQWFLQNYQADKAGERAPDSLLYLAVAMDRLKETKRACVAFAELRDTYPAEVAGRLKTQYDAASRGVKCN